MPKILLVRFFPGHIIHRTAQAFPHFNFSGENVHAAISCRKYRLMLGEKSVIFQIIKKRYTTDVSIMSTGLDCTLIDCAHSQFAQEQMN